MKIELLLICLLFVGLNTACSQPKFDYNSLAEGQVPDSLRTVESRGEQPGSNASAIAVASENTGRSDVSAVNLRPNNYLAWYDSGHAAGTIECELRLEAKHKRNCYERCGYYSCLLNLGLAIIVAALIVSEKFTPQAPCTNSTNSLNETMQAFFSDTSKNSIVVPQAQKNDSPSPLNATNLAIAASSSSVHADDIPLVRSKESQASTAFSRLIKFVYCPVAHRAATKPKHSHKHLRRIQQPRGRR